MKEKKNYTTSAILIAVIFCLLYTILALKPLTTELHFSPEWTADIFKDQKPAEGEELIAYRAGQNIGYFTPDGKIVSAITFPFKAAISDSYYTSYSAGSSQALIYTPEGQLQCTVNEYGFPFLEQDRIYMMLPGGSAFARFDENGSCLWRYESYAPLTAFSSSKGGTAAGFADGTVVCFSEDGSISQKFQPGGSETGIIFGTAVSDDGETVACLSGLNRQRLVVARKNGEHSRIIYHEYMDSDLKRQTLVKFRGNTVYWNYNGGLGIVDTEKNKSCHIKIDGIVTQIEFSPVDQLTFVLSRNGNTYTVTALEPLDKIAGSFSFKAENAFIRVKDDGLFVGRDSKISRITLSRK